MSHHPSVYILLCPDTNECELAQDDCHSNATCHNVVGSFMCACNDGFEGNGTTCMGEKLRYTACTVKIKRGFNPSVVV